jgi:hypothetical protein
VSRLVNRVMRGAQYGREGEIQIGRQRMTYLRCAGDIVWLVCSEAPLHELVDWQESVSKKYCLLINVDKTKVMSTGRTTCNI